MQRMEEPSHNRTITVAEIIEFLEYLAPPALAAPTAPFGLQVGASLSPVETILVSPLPTQRLFNAAPEGKTLLLTAAPLLSEPLSALRWDDPVGARVAFLIRKQVALYTLSCAFAAAPGGLDDCLAERLGLGGSRLLLSTATEAQFKFVVFVPPADVEPVRRAACEAGAGVIGEYTHCSFRASGMGTFFPQEGANPTVGSVGKLVETEEVRLEMLVPERELRSVAAAVLEAHPYEEVAYDIYPLRNPGMMYGRGRIGELPLEVSLETVLAQVQDALELRSEQAVRCSHQTGQPVGVLAVASGAAPGTELLQAAQRQQAGVLVTGGAMLSDLALAEDSDTVLVDVGFAPSVAPGLQRLVAQLRDTFGSERLHIAYVP